MFKQTRAPSEDELRNALGEDYADRWDHTRVSDWLQEKGWPHIAPIFKGENSAFVTPPTHPIPSRYISLLPRKYRAQTDVDSACLGLSIL